MKSLKRFVLLLTAVAMTLAIPFSAACKTDPPEPEVTETLTGITVDASGAKTTYYVGEEFSSANLVVTATVQKSDSTQPETRNVTASATVDSSAYVADTVGSYTIKVSYTLGEVTKEDSYSVNVSDKDGLAVSLADGVSNTITLSEANPTASIDLSKIVVRTVNYTGDVVETEDGILSASDYTTKLYNRGEEVTQGFDSLGEGVYQIWAYAQSKLVSGYQLKGFVVIYVIDEIVKLEKTSTGDTEQMVGNDTISAAWTFRATYASGKTADFTSADLSVKIDTKTAGENKTADISYSYKNAKGESKTASCEVNYTITPKPVQEGDVTYTMTYQVKTTDAANKVGSWVTNWSNNTEDFDKNVTVNAVTTSHLTREKSTVDNSVTFSDYAELKKYQSSNSLTISVGAKATDVKISVYASHTSSSSARTIYLASDTTATDTTKVLDSATIGGTDNLSTNNLHALNATVSAGTYYVFTNDTTVHVYAVVVEYTIPAPTQSDPVVANIGDWVGTDTTKIATYNTETLLAEGIYFTANAENTVAIDKSAKSYAEDNISSDYRLKLSGTGKAGYRSLKIETSGAATITVYMMSSSSTASRSVGLYNSEFTIIGEAQTVGGANLEKHEYTVTAAGTYYIAAASGGTNVYCVILTPNN